MKRFLALLTFCVCGIAAAADPVKLILNWKAEPEFGGFYAAQEQGIFKKAGLQVEILEGGAGIPSVQMVASGKAEFGISQADEILINREKKGDVVALFATYQTSPHAILTHAERGFQSLGDVFATDGVLALQKGLPFALFLQQKFKGARVKIVPYTGGISGLLSDKKLSQQGFVTIEAIEAEAKGLKTKSFLVSEAGFDSYLTVVVTREKTLREKPKLVKDFVAAVREGWAQYLRDPGPTNKKMAQINRTLSENIMEKGAEAQKKFIENEVTKKNGLGFMTEAKWQAIADQLQSLGLLKKKPDVASSFRNQID
jgi:NitT/TauT family transport system substrate-binding protein